MPKKITIPVYFATNRNLVPKPGDDVEFGAGFNTAPNPLTFGRAQCRVLEHREDFSKSDCVIDDHKAQAFTPSTRAEVVNGEGNLLIYLHGFNYPFHEAALRAAWLSQWYAGGKPKMPNTVVLFSWPSQGAFSLAAYRIDVASVGQSGGAFDIFFDALVALIGDYRAANPQGRVVLLAHSLGAYMLTVGLHIAIGKGPGQYDPEGKPTLFDAVILPAADADADALKHPAKLLCLGDLASRVAVYYKSHDRPLTMFAEGVHNSARLGVDGPPNKPAFKDLPYEFVNCATASPTDDDTGAELDWQRHQYYRLVPEVRDDICGVAANLAPETMPNRKFRPQKNYYSLYLK